MLFRQVCDVWPVGISKFDEILGGFSYERSELPTVAPQLCALNDPENIEEVETKVDPVL